jgi:hypothetical protein
MDYKYKMIGRVFNFPEPIELHFSLLPLDSELEHLQENSSSLTSHGLRTRLSDFELLSC